MRKYLLHLFFCAFLFISTSAFCSPEIREIHSNKDTVGLYENFELQLNLLAKYQNPFDPKEIDIITVFTSPSGIEWRINGFYNYSKWSTLWMVRFSPNEIGNWSYRISVKDLEDTSISDPGTFTVISSPYKGPIRISANSRYLEYDDETPYYGVGFWYNDDYYGFNSGRIRPETLDHLKSLGVNFITTFITPLETMASGVGRYDQDICGRLDEVLEMCEERELNVSLNIWLHPYLSETRSVRRWFTNPYQLVTEAKDFYNSKESWAYQENLYRYMIARWGHSRSLAIWFVVDEINGTDGWHHDSLGCNIWARQVHDYFKKKDPYGRLTTGSRSGGIREFWHEGNQIFDFANTEIYEAQGWPIIRDGRIDPDSTHPLTLSYRNYAWANTRLWDGYSKPNINGETGWNHTFYEPGMPGYLATYHNALWVSLATGTAMTPFWWAYHPFLNDNLVTRQLLTFERFVSTIPFNKLTGLKLIEDDITLSNGDAYGVKSDQMIFGWVVNANADVTGATVNINSVPAGEYTVKIYHTWRGVFIEEIQVSSVKESVTFKLPILKISGGIARYLGQDAAFVMIPANQ